MAGRGSRIEEGHNMLRQRGGADQPQPRIKLAATKTTQARMATPAAFNGMVKRDPPDRSTNL